MRREVQKSLFADYRLIVPFLIVFSYIVINNRSHTYFTILHVHVTKQK